jgi:23S rRNA U2552 (ribose-2'-O)-methylase RlmE/FtsJ
MSCYLLPPIIYSKEFYKNIQTDQDKDDGECEGDGEGDGEGESECKCKCKCKEKEKNKDANLTQPFLINKTLQKYLNALKAQIDVCESAWDKYKKYTNPYEFIHTTVPNARNAICHYKPLSRSFFKMIEMCHMLNILAGLPVDRCNSFHLAEGPGGFIEALVFLRNNARDTYYGMTLLEEHNQNVPGWRKSKQFLAEHSNVIIEKGFDDKGDLMNPQNLLHCYKHYKGRMDLITGDGGFDFSVHYLSQETVSAPLILCQISFAIAMQNSGGTFILKMFDTFSKISVDMLYLLANVYETVHLVKPHTSRYANSEKYIICKNFKLDDAGRQEMITVLYKIMVHMKEVHMKEVHMKEVHMKEVTVKLQSLFLHPLPYYFVNKLEEYNAILGQQQIENIASTLNLMENNKYDKLELIKKTNIQKCIAWCQQYKLDYHASVQPSNIFLMNRLAQVTTVPAFAYKPLPTMEG